MKKLVAILLVASMLFSIVACANDTTEDNQDTENAVNEGGELAEESTDPVETEPEELKPDLPETDMQGKNFNVLVANWGYTPLDTIDIWTEDMTGEAINDDAFERNLYMNDTYNCTVSINTMLNGQDTTALQQSIMAEDFAYDFSLSRGMQLASQMTQGLLMDLADIPHVNYDNPWWDSNSYEQLATLGKHFAVTSDLTTSDELAVWSLFFNKQMIDEYSFDNPYALVNDGKWTYDAMFSMASQVSKDLNSDGDMTFEDQFGVSHIRDTTMGMFNGVNVYLAKTNEEGIPALSYTDEESVSKIINILERLYDKNTCFNYHIRGTNSGKDETQMFIDNQVLFLIGGIYYTAALRNMDTDFGILPYPKYDENQATYSPSTCGIFLTLLVVPKVVENIEWLGTFLEAYAWYGYKYIRPDFYESLLQRKVARDAESLEMLDLIFNNLIYDWGNITNIGGLSLDIIMLQNMYNSNIASYIKRRGDRDQTAINDLIAAIEGLN